MILNDTTDSHTSCIASAGILVLFKSSLIQIEAITGADTEANCERNEPIGVRQASRINAS